jgi:hypothetical protein
MAQAAAPFLYTEAARYDPQDGERFPSGARLMLVEAGSAHAFVPAFTASADAAVSFDGARVLFAGKQKPGEPWQIWETAIAGGAPRRVTSGDDDCIRPFYMPGDSLVYARHTAAGYEIELAPLAGGTPLRLTYGYGNHIPSDVLLDGRVLFDAPHGAGTREVYTVYADGSGVETVRCDHGRDRHSGRQVSSGDIVFVSGTRLARFTSARAVELALTLPNGEYAGTVAEPEPGELLAPWRAAAGGRFTLLRMKIGDTQPTPRMRENLNQLDPVMVRAHAVPKRHPSSLGDRDGANILCLNVYTSREGGIPEGVVKAVRVWGQDDAGATILLGQTAVEQDGSFFVQVPSERPIRFELLDGTSKTVRDMQGWFWARRGEQRVCVGCHAGPERAPDNAAPAVLLRTTDPVKMCGNCHADKSGSPKATQPSLPVH